MGFFSFIVLLAIAYLIWRVTDQLPDLIFRLSEIQRDVAEIRRRLADQGGGASAPGASSASTAGSSAAPAASSERNAASSTSAPPASTPGASPAPGQPASPSVGGAYATRCGSVDRCVANRSTSSITRTAPPTLIFSAVSVGV